MEKSVLRPKIFEAVDALRQRKCRPDRESIAHFILRKHGVKFNEVFNELESIVDEELLIKVEFKGSTSYRLPSQFDKGSSPLLTKHSKILNSVQTTRCIIKAVNDLLVSNETYNTEGIPLEELKSKLLSLEPERFKDGKANVAVERELFSKSGNLFKSLKGRIFPKDIPIPLEDMKKSKRRGRKRKGVVEEDEEPEEEQEQDAVDPDEAADLGEEEEEEVVETKSKAKPKPKIISTKKRARRGGLVESTQCVICFKPIEKESSDDMCVTCSEFAKKIPKDGFLANKGGENETETDAERASTSAKEGIEKLGKNPSDWTSAEVETYFQFKGLREEGAILKEQEIDGLSLLLMKRKDITQNIPKLLLGPALKVHRVINELQFYSDQKKV